MKVGHISFFFSITTFYLTRIKLGLVSLMPDARRPGVNYLPAHRPSLAAGCLPLRRKAHEVSNTMIPLPPFAELHVKPPRISCSYLVEELDPHSKWVPVERISDFNPTQGGPPLFMTPSGPSVFDSAVSTATVSLLRWESFHESSVGSFFFRLTAFYLTRIKVGLVSLVPCARRPGVNYLPAYRPSLAAGCLPLGRKSHEVSNTMIPLSPFAKLHVKPPRISCS